MRRRSALWRSQIVKSVGAVFVALFLLSACGGSSTTSTPGAPSQPKPPIKIGISVSLSGDFSADGKAFQQGYQVWADGLKPRLSELLGPRAPTDAAPPPTGDPARGNSGMGR